MKIPWYRPWLVPLSWLGSQVRNLHHQRGHAPHRWNSCPALQCPQDWQLIPGTGSWRHKAVVRLGQNVCSSPSVRSAGPGRTWPAEPGGGGGSWSRGTTRRDTCPPTGLEEEKLVSLILYIRPICQNFLLQRIFKVITKYLEISKNFKWQYLQICTSSSWHRAPGSG